MLQIFSYLANAMESSGIVGKLHCSEAVYKKLKNNPMFLFEECEEKNIDGFGNREIDLWVLEKLKILYSFLFILGVQKTYFITDNTF